MQKDISDTTDNRQKINRYFKFKMKNLLRNMVKTCYICKKKVTHLKKHCKREHLQEYRKSANTGASLKNPLRKADSSLPLESPPDTVQEKGKKSQPYKREKQPQLLENPINMHRAMEKTHAAMERLLQERDFNSAEEANAYLQQFTVLGGGMPIPPPQRDLTPVEQAQEIMYKAWNEPKQIKRIILARRALALSPDCADAYVLLAEENKNTLEETKHLFEEGVKAGERSLGKEFFKEEVGRFWGILESRPYMRAQFGLAQVLWELNERKEAIIIYKELLRLNPNDNQGVRHILVNALLQEGLDNEVEMLLRQYDDDPSAVWAYTRALLAFRRFNAALYANNHLKAALKTNPFVPLYLLGLQELPSNLPEYMGFGDANEAICYVSDAYEGWLNTPGAIEWLANMFLTHMKADFLELFTQNMGFMEKI